MGISPAMQLLDSSLYPVVCERRAEVGSSGMGGDWSVVVAVQQEGTVNRKEQYMYKDAAELETLSRNDLDELFAERLDDPLIQAEYRRRGIDPDSGEELADIAV